MHIYLVQHGAAVPKDENPERPLSGQGREGVLTEQDPTLSIVLDGASVRLAIGRVEWVLSDVSP